MFVSAFFLVFLGIVSMLFFLLPVKFRQLILLVSSYVFCGFVEVRALVVLIFISFFTWAAGLKIEKLRVQGRIFFSKTGTVAVTVFFCSLLCGYKYLPSFFRYCGMDSRLPESVAGQFIMPVGLSFYLFQAIGYLVDIYKGKSQAERSFLLLSCHLAFFPKLVSGPIEREQDFLPQLKRLCQVKAWDRGRLSTAFTYMLWGYFMKMVVADRLAVTVGGIFGNPVEFDSFWLLVGMLFYTIQIYCDFAGYSYIAIGCAKIFGLELTHNFKAPYLAGSISDFWRRWHVSLSTWLRDYIYIPLGGNRKGTVRKCINTMIVFLICGMWHGAGINFMIWGLLHGLYSVVETISKKMGWKVKGGRMITFFSVAFAWIFFRADTARAGFTYIGRMFTAGIHLEEWGKALKALNLSGVEIGVIFLGIAVIWLVDNLCNRKKIHLPVLIQYRENAARYFVFYLLIMTILIFGMYGPGYHAEQFIYMQF